jgi:type IV fimbrial biogenesis protein FimT
MKRREKGLTLIELMVTLAVAIVLLAIGIPAFNSMTARDISAATVNGLVTALQQARTEAIGRGTAITVESADWSSAWSVKAGSDVLRTFTAPRPKQVKVTGGVSPLIFTARGESSTPTTFTVTAFADSTQTTCVRKVNLIISAVGQIRSEDKACP